ncbi:ABC transporter ATP-binding protein [Aquibium oceanicum]|uniref:ABC transporter ATP-binding protein n=1 Tax=Aquibium oceanicum TaxID=1670800 RepID=A0A1L3SMS0_9HYPH|nr:ABC transporter ATP-binding protein [Aquibium oceanicum]APH70693.1 ABC transporter ATP-binding protein [Aquibium oceanicum]
MTALLSTRNVETYYGPIMAIGGVSIDVPEGKIVCVLGANGAGKTTLLKTISGAIDCRKGQVLFRGEEVQNRNPDAVAACGIAHVPEGREVFPFMSVEENLIVGAWGRSDKDAVARDMEAVYQYFPDLATKRHDMAGFLSGGQQQMLAIGRGLMGDASLMILDEPSLGLSPLLTQMIFGIVRRINRERGITILLVEQNAVAALDLADHGYVMEVGRIVMDAPTSELRESDDIREFYLGKSDEGIRGEKRWKKRKTWR